MKIKVRPSKTFQRAGDNLKVKISLDIYTAVLGGKLSVPTMSGNVSLTIPPRTQGGRTFRLRGKGMPRMRENGQFGDLLVTVSIEIPEELTDDELHLFEQLADLHMRKQ